MESRTQFQCVVDVVVFYTRKQLEEHAAYPNAHHEVICFFHFIKPKDVDHKFAWDCKNILGSRSMHSICTISHIDVTLLNLRQLACFCPKCMDDNASFCENNSMGNHGCYTCLNPTTLHKQHYHKMWV
jgi:hypothetical protein